MDAVAETWDPRRHDEVIVSTLPGQSSRWIHGDLPRPRRAAHRRAGHARRGQRHAARAARRAAAGARDLTAGAARRPRLGTRRRASSSSRLPKGSAAVEAPDPRQPVVPRDRRARRLEARGERVELRPRRPTSPGGAFVAGANGSSTPTCSCCVAEREPGAAARAHRLRLLDLGQPEQPAVERPRRCLAARRRGDLDVVEPHAATASSSVTCASSWPASHAPTIRASTSSSAGSQPPRPPGAGALAQRHARCARRAPRSAVRGRQRTPVDDAAADDPERVGARRVARVRREHEPRARRARRAARRRAAPSSDSSRRRRRCSHAARS